MVLPEDFDLLGGCLIEGLIEGEGAKGGCEVLPGADALLGGEGVGVAVGAEGLGRRVFFGHQVNYMLN